MEKVENIETMHRMEEQFNDTNVDMIYSNIPIVKYLQTLPISHATDILFHFSNITPSIISYGFNCPFNSVCESMLDTIAKYQYIIDAFRIVCPNIVVYADLVAHENTNIIYKNMDDGITSPLNCSFSNNSNINDVDVIIQLNWKYGEMNPIVYDKKLTNSVCFTAFYEKTNEYNSFCKNVSNISL